MKVKTGIPWVLIIQVILLVIGYGNIIPNLPWFVIWFPCLLVVGILSLYLLIIAIILIVAVIAAFI
jgi:ABC-type multidrug transport system permease subunit